MSYVSESSLTFKLVRRLIVSEKVIAIIFPFVIPFLPFLCPIRISIAFPYTVLPIAFTPVISSFL